MTNLTLLTLAGALGLRHGVDPDHLAVIDGLSRVHPSRWNGILFAFGHGALVTLLAVGIGGFLANKVEPYAPWLLIFLGASNLWRLRKTTTHPHSHVFRLQISSPLILGIFFGAGFETASQLSMLFLAADTNPWVLGIVFSAGMVLVDGTDGYLASRTQTRAIAGGRRALQASRALGMLVVTFSLGLGCAELLKVNIDPIALPLGCALFGFLVILRLWSAHDPQKLGQAGESRDIAVPTLGRRKNVRHLKMFYTKIASSTSSLLTRIIYH
jgi:nickel/cobalt transporter (NiCoT) family protein